MILSCILAVLKCSGVIKTHVSLLPHSVKHVYDRWEKHATKLSTCNPYKKIFVSSAQEWQEIDNGQEVVFTYDVAFKVRNSSHNRSAHHV